MSADRLRQRVDELCQFYSEDDVDELLNAAPLVLDVVDRAAVRRGLSAILDGENGHLVFAVGPLPGQPPRATWIGAGFRVVAEMIPVDLSP